MAWENVALWITAYFALYVILSETVSWLRRHQLDSSEKEYLVTGGEQRYEE